MNNYGFMDRTQDKTTLIRSYEIYISEQPNTYLIRAKRTSHILGVYNTFERALEVLDEIQELLMPKIIFKDEGRDYITPQGQIYKLNITQSMNTNIQQLSSYVYEMPKE